MSWWRFWQSAPIFDVPVLDIPALEPDECRAPRLTDRGIKLIKISEGYKSEPYLCSARVWTIGFGTTLDSFFNPVTSDHPKINVDTAVELFERDIKIFSAGVLSCVKVPINDNQFSALTSLAYNIGLTSFRSSTVLRKLNRGNYDGCAGNFWQWRRANGVISKGLVTRRKLEADLFMS